MARKIKNAMGDCIKTDIERMGEEWRKEHQIERIGDICERGHSERKVRERKETMETEIIVNSLLTTGMPRKEEQQNVI